MPSFADFLFQARIISVTANPRNGKTRMMVDMIKDLADNGIPSYVDFHVAGVNCDKIVPGQLPIDYPDDPHYLASFSDIKERDFPKGSVLFLDELIKEFDNRLTMGKTEETKYRSRLTQSFMQIGKKHLRVVHAEQITRTIDWRIAYLSEMFLVPRPTAYKIVDQEVINVEFDVTPVINEGIFGFREMPHYYMDENRFWYYAFEYDSDEPVLSEEEKLEARAKVKKLEQKKIEEENHRKNIERKTRNPKSLRAQAAEIDAMSARERLKKYAQENPLPVESDLHDDPRDAADDHGRSGDTGIDENRIGLYLPVSNSIKNHADYYENVSSSDREPGRKINSRSYINPINQFRNNVSESHFYFWLESIRAA